MHRNQVLEHYGDVQGQKFKDFVQLFVAMKEQDPNATIFDLEFLVKKLTGLELADLLEEGEIERLAPLISPDPIEAMSIIEGIGAFP